MLNNVWFGLHAHEISLRTRNELPIKNETELVLKHCYNVHTVLSSEISGVLGPSESMIECLCKIGRHQAKRPWKQYWVNDGLCKDRLGWAENCAQMFYFNPKQI